MRVTNLTNLELVELLELTSRKFVQVKTLVCCHTAEEYNKKSNSSELTEEEFKKLQDFYL